MSAPETPAAPALDAAMEQSEERHRLAVLAASGPLLLLLAPIFFPLDDKGPLYPLAAREPGAFVMFLLVFVWPLFVGAFGLRRALTRRAPGLAAYAVPAVVQLLGAAGFAFLVAQELSRPWRSRTHPELVASLGLCALILFVLLRGFRRKGWTRYAQGVAGMWLVFFTFVLLVGAEARYIFDPPQSGGWLLLFALSAAAPAVGWILTHRRVRG